MRQQAIRKPRKGRLQGRPLFAVSASAIARKVRADERASRYRRSMAPRRRSTASSAGPSGCGNPLSDQEEYVAEALSPGRTSSVTAGNGSSGEPRSMVTSPHGKSRISRSRGACRGLGRRGEGLPRVAVPAGPNVAFPPSTCAPCAWRSSRAAQAIKLNGRSERSCALGAGRNRGASSPGEGDVVHTVASERGPRCGCPV